MTENFSSIAGKRCHINTRLPQSALGFPDGSHRGCAVPRPRPALSPPSTALLTLPQTEQPLRRALTQPAPSPETGLFMQHDV